MRSMRRNARSPSSVTHTSMARACCGMSIRLLVSTFQNPGLAAPGRVIASMWFLWVWPPIHATTLGWRVRFSMISWRVG